MEKKNILKTPVRYLKGVGPRKEIVLNKRGIYDLHDLLYYFPFRYEDRRNICPISKLEEGKNALICAKIMARNLKPFRKTRFTYRAKDSILEILVSDDTGLASCVWFHQGYYFNKLEVGKTIIAYGRVRNFAGRFQIISPEFEIVDQEEISRFSGSIFGVYRGSEGLSAKVLRKLIHQALENYGGFLNDPLPFFLRERYGFLNLKESLRQIHLPDDWQRAEIARRRFIFEELFFSQILVYLRKARHRSQKSLSFLGPPEFLEQIHNNLNFTLTLSQKKVVAEILNDISKPVPMHRLVQGDVGSGKTVVAAFAIGVVAYLGGQVALMAPTEVLAFQHYQYLSQLFSFAKFKIEFLSASLSTKQKKQIYDKLKAGDLNIIVGTHSLLEEEVEFKNLSLVIIDEQHKFGVAQRALLPKKASGYVPHCLVMSATPIPRSLALSLYGDLDLSIIDSLPEGRKIPQTKLVREKDRNWAYNFLISKLKEGRQGYIVFPMIEDNSELTVHSLEEMITHIKKKLKGFNVEMFHGRMESKEKHRVIEEFRQGKVDVLVATSVVEVGVNVENASVMIVESPQRFGLSQLHQLRGRIQRSTHQPFFILISPDQLPEEAERRLKVICQVNDGFKIAEEDLKLRGPGDFFGHSQSGFPELKLANPLRDIELLTYARKEAYHLIKNDPFLRKKENRFIKEHLEFWLRRNNR